MLLPMLILLWIVGWTMFWTGSQEYTDKTSRVKKKDDDVSIIMAPTEEMTA
jgi:lipopolysaccharide export system protein LptC